jgi:hypothetical protein
MTDSIHIAIQALQDKSLELRKEKERGRRRLLELALRDQQIDRDVEGCIAGARALGGQVAVPPETPIPEALKGAFQQFLTGRNLIIASYKGLRNFFDGDASQGDDVPLDGILDAEEEMPRIADIIMDRLGVAGQQGAKAAEIRRFILSKYDADIHEKTVGMTLYRLQKDSKVRREGHTWFLASPEAKSPGAANAGDDFDDLLGGTTDAK